VIVMPWPKPDYESAVAKAGGEVRVLSPADDRLPAALEGADGVLLTGGADVDPALYGESAHPTVEVDPERDEYEIALARLAIARDLPVLAICRGAQVLNVAAGGTLIQDIPSAEDSALAHSVVEPRTAIAHDVRVSPASTLAQLLAGDLDADGRVPVNSRHHQSVRDVAPGFVVNAVAPDGIVEGLEKPGACFCVGVQWHPENFWRTGAFGGLFEGFVKAAAERKRKALVKSGD
jgi:putative glutamine amidotransferase